MTCDLYIWMLCNCLAYFSQNLQIWNWCINWWELCSLDVHYFLHVFLSVYFCFACQIYVVHAQFFGKIKTNEMQAVYITTIAIPFCLWMYNSCKTWKKPIEITVSLFFSQHWTYFGPNFALKLKGHTHFTFFGWFLMKYIRGYN